ncbi:MAG TPA: hypothetical protein ENI95_09665 [Chloroflexi bacterium]|nr:hypothetical protein [Chloroflexota bacterium]
MSDNNIPENEKPQEETIDVAAEFAELGRKFRDAINAAWNSEERLRIQQEIKEGLERFSEEVDEAIKSLRESEISAKVEESVKRVREDLESGKVADEVRRGLVTALRGLSDALDKMASSFTPPEGEDSPRE